MLKNLIFGQTGKQIAILVASFLISLPVKSPCLLVKSPSTAVFFDSPPWRFLRAAKALLQLPQLCVDRGLELRNASGPWAGQAVLGGWEISTKKWGFNHRKVGFNSPKMDVKHF